MSLTHTASAPRRDEQAPLVSVVVPAYNAERFITRTLECVLAQTYRNIEVVVADDGSTDGTRACVEAFRPRVRYLRQPNSGGAARPRNLGILASRGSLVAFVDADDLMLPGRIASAVAAFARFPAAGLVLSNFQNFDETGLQSPDHFTTCSILRGAVPTLLEGPALLSSQLSTDVLLTENFGSSAPIVRRAALDAVGGYDETTPPSEDFDLNYRIAARFPIVTLPDVLLQKRAHDGNLSSNLPRLLRAQILIRERLAREVTRAHQQRALRRGLAACYRRLAYYYTGRDNALAVHYEWKSVAAGRRASLTQWARIAADLAGRDTLRHDRR